MMNLRGVNQFNNEESSFILETKFIFSNKIIQHYVAHFNWKDKEIHFHSFLFAFKLHSNQFFYFCLLLMWLVWNCLASYFISFISGAWYLMNKFYLSICCIGERSIWKIHIFFISTMIQMSVATLFNFRAKRCLIVFS